MLRNVKLKRYFDGREAQGKRTFALCGGRRSGKTYFVCQELVIRAYQDGDIVNVATMTAEQGRLGAYADCKDIINGEAAFRTYFDVLSSPREIRCRHNGGRIFFNSYQNSETAKGITCDWLFVNEANNFTKQQYTDLTANVRKGVFVDYNPNRKFWVDDYFAQDEICNTTWNDNRAFLTPLQLEYFANLKRLGDRPDASAVDRRNYLVYYEGVYSELMGDIFTSDNMRRGRCPTNLKHPIVFVDPSALRGNDYFAAVLTGVDDEGVVWVEDAFSTNTGTRAEVTARIIAWLRTHDKVRVFVETNGFVGIDYYEFAVNSGIAAEAWNSRGNKFERIVAQFENVTGMMFADTQEVSDYLVQCYEFGEKCEHDDNIDAIVSALLAHKLTH